MKVKFIGESSTTGLLHGKEYEVQAIEQDWYRIIGEDDDDDEGSIPGYLYPPELFETVERQIK